MRFLFSIYLILNILFGAVAFADDFDDANQAYDAGDFAKAHKLYRMSAKDGDELAQFNLGLMYLQGKGVSQDYDEAVKWFRLSADQGYAKAQYNMGVAYDQGMGVKKDEKESFRWNKLAAESGHAGAQFQLAYDYAIGDVVPHDLLRAYMWFYFAAEQNEDNAADNRDYAIEQMTDAQYAKAKSMVSACIAQDYQGC
ncbi:tetratricopeptide repeat protein [uncultured Kiloniella sp.]|uniref:tetratricopeptide repeat protein n=1 Tax=uncultured Kiloniella sp. TaxID=1133091 RepID=UPI002610FE40|nr:tetratricopeptide repeat protein [uncultured Kiloniella sp.]